MSIYATRCCGSGVSLFAGQSREALEQALADAQAAYMRFQLGGMGVSYSYTQGDGTRSVTYSATSLAQLAAYIRQLQQALGIVCRARNPARFIYHR
jgi:hypothetical protein